VGSFDIIIGMNWLANNHALIVCDEKIVHISFGDKILIVQGDRSDKTQMYMEKGLAGYYRRFIEGFSKIAKPMTKLTQKSMKFDWGDCIVHRFWHCPKEVKPSWFIMMLLTKD
ncbi:hypothetical protein Tco_1560336, partial [Tanacetum coccineum]